MENKKFDGLKEFQYLGGLYRTNESYTVIQCVYADGKWYTSNSLAVRKAAQEFVNSL